MASPFVIASMNEQTEQVYRRKTLQQTLMMRTATGNIALK